jgi:HD-like signal output (HDOD) protein
MSDLSQAEAEKLIASVAIPTRPSADPNLGRIAQLVAVDVGLTAAMIKTINSPFYGLRQKVTDIQRAVSMLGLDRFWDSAARKALIAAYLAKQLGGRRQGGRPPFRPVP